MCDAVTGAQLRAAVGPARVWHRRAPGERHDLQIRTPPLLTSAHACCAHLLFTPTRARLSAQVSGTTLKKADILDDGIPISDNVFGNAGDDVIPFCVTGAGVVNFSTCGQSRDSTLSPPLPFPSLNFSLRLLTSRATVRPRELGHDPARVR